MYIYISKSYLYYIFIYKIPLVRMKLSSNFFVFFFWNSYSKIVYLFFFCYCWEAVQKSYFYSLIFDYYYYFFTLVFIEFIRCKILYKNIIIIRRKNNIKTTSSSYKKNLIKFLLKNIINKKKMTVLSWSITIVQFFTSVYRSKLLILLLYARNFLFLHLS